MINYFSDFRFVDPFRRYSRSKSKVVRNREKFWTVFKQFSGQDRTQTVSYTDLNFLMELSAVFHR